MSETKTQDSPLSEPNPVSAGEDPSGIARIPAAAKSSPKALEDQGDAPVSKATAKVAKEPKGDEPPLLTPGNALAGCAVA